MLARVGMHRKQHRYLVECKRCGRRLRYHQERLRVLPDRPCGCDPGQPEQPPPRRPLDVDHWTPWDEDDVCWLVTHLHPEGLERAQVGELMGVDVRTVGVIEHGALRKIAALAEQGNADALAMLRHLREQADTADEDRPWPDWDT